MNRFGLAMVLALVTTQSAAAQEAKSVATTEPGVTADAYRGLPVVAGDIADRPYRILGEVNAGVRKATIFSKSSSQQKIYRELWERARKMGADAVIHASYGKAHVTAVSWGKTNATGTAIKFTDSPAR